MTTTPIMIQVDEETAKAFAAASAEQRRKMELLLRLRLRDLTDRSQRPMKEVMDDIGSRARARGLTEETLESLLNDE